MDGTGEIGALDILFRLFGQVSIPSPVHQEVVVEGKKQSQIDALIAENAIRRKQINIVDVAPSDFPTNITALALDAGEKAAIYLSTQTAASLILLDDMKAREEAKALGLSVKGTLGVLVQAYRQNLSSFEEINASIETIMVHDDIWISAELCREVLKGIETERQEKNN